MKPRDRVKAAIHFTGPDRVPVFTAGLGDVFPMVMLPSKHWQPPADVPDLFPHVADDILIKLRLWRWKKPTWAKGAQYKRTRWLNLPREAIDEWGCYWNRAGGDVTMGHPGRASLSDWADLDAYLAEHAPDPDDKSRYRLFAFLRKLVGRKRYRLGLLGHVGPSQTASMIRGFDRYLVDHFRHRAELRKLLARLTEFYVGCMDGWIKYAGKPDGFWLVDDLGEQSGPFFSPRMFEKFYEDVYGTLAKAAHDRGCELGLHCCGKVDRLLPALIDWGLDMIEFDSPRMSGYADLAPFRGKIMFWGCVNIQSIYPLGTPAECEREVWHMIRNLGTRQGGFGAYFYPQRKHIHAPKENVAAFKRGLEKYGVYANIPDSWWTTPVLHEQGDEWQDDVVPPLPEIRNEEIG